MARQLTFILLTLALALAAAPPARAALSDEVAAGQALARQLEAGDANCKGLTDDDFEQLGEYAMNRMAGSQQLHAAMNERMRSVMGAEDEERMHVLIGQRYAGCASTGDAGAMTAAPGMMGGQGWSEDRARDSMMGQRDSSWMRDGNWQQMDRQDWQGVSKQWMGPGMMGSDNGWSAGERVLAGVIGLLAIGMLVAGLVVTVRRRSAVQSPPPS